MGAFLAKSLIFFTWSKVKVYGKNNIPDQNNICFVSNHQGYFDIILIFGYLRKKIGFIAKKELKKIPILSFWMKTINCIFIDRNDHKGSINAINKRMEYIKNGNPMIIFPEGTRSKDVKINRFKTGGLKLLIQNNLKIVPITINGTYKLFEKKGEINSGDISLYIHKPIDLSNLSDNEKENIPSSLFEIISGPLKAESS